MNHLLKKLIIPLTFISFTSAIFEKTLAMDETALGDEDQVRRASLPQLQEDIPDHEGCKIMQRE